MATWLEKQRDKARREKLSRELTHQQSYGQTDPRAQAMLDYARVTQDPNYVEPGLQGGVPTENVTGFGLSPLDLIGTGFGTKVASLGGSMLGALGATAIASKASKGAKLSDLARVMKSQRGVLSTPEQRLLQSIDVRKDGGTAMSAPDKPFKFGGKDFYKTESGNAYAGDSLISESEYQKAMQQALSGDVGGGLSYQIQHKPMTIEGGASPLHDLTSSFGEDIYGKQALQYFGSGDPREKSTLRILQSLKGKPDAMVTIYRGAPADAGGINAGDWVTLDRKVAQDYVDQALANEGKSGKVFAQQVPASHVTSWPDSLLEFGYHPKGSK